MDKKDFSDLEDQIKDTVKSAFNAIDFAGIKKDIGDMADSTLKDVKTKIKYKSDDAISKLEYKSNDVKMKIKDKSKKYNEKIEKRIQKQYNNEFKVAKRDENKTKMYICKRPTGSISGIVYTVLGFTFSGVLGILLIIYPMITSLLNILSEAINVSLAVAFYVGLGVLFSFFAASMALALRGRSLRKRVKRFKQYVRSLEGHNYCSIQELASAVRRKEKYVLKDLRKMVDLGMFKEAHIDEKQTYFMLGNEVYDNYLKSQESLKIRNEEELKRKEKLNEESNDPEKEKLRYTIEMVKDYVEQIKDVNNAISEEEISSKLYKLQNIVYQIINHVEKNPKKLSEVNKFTNHYLPITLKLVNSYKELNDQPVEGENIKKAKKEIEKSIDIINIAFEKLLDGLFEEIALDISTDISVLETLFTQEGLTKKDFEK